MTVIVMFVWVAGGSALAFQPGFQSLRDCDLARTTVAQAYNKLSHADVSAVCEVIALRGSPLKRLP